VTGTYVLDVNGDSVLGDTVLSLSLVSPQGVGGTLIGTWVRVDSVSNASPFNVIAGGNQGSALHLSWLLDADRPAVFDGVRGPAGFVGGLRLGGRAYAATLLPLDPESAAPLPPPVRGWFDPGGRAVVVIRLDDTRDSDRELIPELERLQLKADFSVITQRVNTPQFLTWSELSDLYRRGEGIVAHSRFHLPGPLSVGRFASEVLGSKIDLLSHGFDVRTFAIVGTWLGPSYLDSVPKLRRARGRIIRRYFDGTVAWIYAVPQLIPLADSLRYGISHINCDHFSVRNVMANIRLAIRNAGYVELVYHSYLADKTLLFPVWDSLAMMRDAGQITIVSSAVGVSAARDGAPALRAAGGGPFSSSNVSLVDHFLGACSATAATLDSASIALDPECELHLRLRTPLPATAVAVETLWQPANDQDTLVLTLTDAGDAARTNQRTCIAGQPRTFCTVRLGMSRSGTDVIAAVPRTGGNPGRAVVTRSALSVE